MIPSLICLAAAGLLLGAATLRDRKLAVVMIVTAFAIASWLIPFPELQEMGDARLLALNNAAWPPSAIRFEAHLSYFLLSALYHFTGTAAGDPRPLVWLSHAAGVLFLIELLVVCVVYGWTEEVIRYTALAIAAPVTLMFFGYQELGYLALSPLAFPLLLKGGPWLNVAAAVLGVHAALHGFGLVALVGAALVVFTGDRLARVFAFGTAFYLIWVFVYVVGINAQISTGHAEGMIFRPLFLSAIAERRELDAIFSSRGLRDVIAGLVIAGAPLLATARYRPALLYAIPSILFSIWFWPVQGLAVESDLVLASFPAMFALMWGSAVKPRATVIAFVLLGLAHVMFWWVVQNENFVNHRMAVQ